MVLNNIIGDIEQLSCLKLEVFPRKFFQQLCQNQQIAKPINQHLKQQMSHSQKQQATLLHISAYSYVQS